MFFRQNSLFPTPVAHLIKVWPLTVLERHLASVYGTRFNVSERCIAHCLVDSGPTRMNRANGRATLQKLSAKPIQDDEINARWKIGQLPKKHKKSCSFSIFMLQCIGQFKAASSKQCITGRKSLFCHLHFWLPSANVFCSSETYATEKHLSFSLSTKKLGWVVLCADR